MYLRITQRQNRDGSTVAYYGLAESIWNPDAKRREARVVHSFGRADQLDRAALERLVSSINRVLDNGADAGKSKPDVPEIDIEQVFELGVVLAARTLWDELGIGPAIRACAARAHLTAPHETALFAMAANRLDDPVSKLACAERWLPDIAWLPDAAGVAVDQCYRALDFLAVWSDEIERDVFLKTADLFRLDVDLIFYDTTTAYFEIDEPDETEQEFAGRLYAPLRRRGHSKEGRDNQPQVIIALAVTRDGMIQAHVKLCMLALQMQRAAEIRCQLPWARIAHALGTLKAVRYRCEGRAIVQRTKVAAALAAMLKTLGISVPKQILAVEDSPQAAAAA